MLQNDNPPELRHKLIAAISLLIGIGAAGMWISGHYHIYIFLIAFNPITILSGIGSSLYLFFLALIYIICIVTPISFAVILFTRRRFAQIRQNVRWAFRITIFVICTLWITGLAFGSLILEYTYS